MRKIFWQGAGIGILSLFGWGVNLIPSVTSWIPAASIWALAFIWLIGIVIYWRRRQKPITQAIQEPQLEFGVRVEEVSVRQSRFLGESTWHETPKCLVMKISFRTNQVIQIAYLHLEINSVDHREIIEPNTRLAQGFHLPYILNQSETHEFQFEVIPVKKPGIYKMTLSVLAGGDWYSDGPYDIGL